MPMDLRVVMPDRPGMLLTACEALAGAGVNLEGLCGDLRPGETWGYIHMLVEDVAKATDALAKVNMDVVDVHRVDVIAVENRPGALVEALHNYTERGENIEVLYVAGDNQIAIGTDRMREPRYGVRMADARYPERARRDSGRVIP